MGDRVGEPVGDIVRDGDRVGDIVRDGDRDGDIVRDGDRVGDFDGDGDCDGVFDIVGEMEAIQRGKSDVALAATRCALAASQSAMMTTAPFCPAPPVPAT